MDPQPEVAQLILEIADEFNNDLKCKIPVERGGQAPLYGREGVLDSLGLVSFIMAVEQAVEDKFGVALTLADEKAMSQRHSPFRTIGALADYVAGLMREAA